MTTATHDDDCDCPRGLTELCLRGGWHAGITVDLDGQSWPWLFAPPEDDPGTPDPGQVTYPTHELTGPLPVEYDPRYCRQPTTYGTPCRNRAGSCGSHRKAST